MPWLVLVVSAVLEAVWATALGDSHGLSRTGPTVVFAVALVASMVGLAKASRSIPIGTAYAVWTGLGAALTVTWAVIAGGESASAAKVLLLSGVVAAVIGLKLVAPTASAPPPPPDRPATD